MVIRFEKFKAKYHKYFTTYKYHNCFLIHLKKIKKNHCINYTIITSFQACLEDFKNRKKIHSDINMQ
jgi:hypothetical protein